MRGGIAVITALLSIAVHAEQPHGYLNPSRIGSRYHFECQGSEIFSPGGRSVGKLSLKRYYASDGRENGFNFDLKLDNEAILQDVDPPMFVEFEHPKNNWEIGMDQGLHIWWREDLKTILGSPSRNLGHDQPILSPYMFISFNQTQNSKVPGAYVDHELILKPGSSNLGRGSRDGFVYLKDRNYLSRRYFDRVMSFYEDSSLPFRDLTRFASRSGKITAYLVVRRPVDQSHRYLVTSDRIVLQRLTFNLKDFPGVDKIFTDVIKPWINSTSDYRQCKMVSDD